MKVSIAIVTLLIVGSNAGLLSGLLGPVINLLDPTVSQATDLLNSLQSQIRQTSDGAVVTVKGELKKVTDAVYNLENRALFIANGLVARGVPEASGLVSTLTNVIKVVLGIVGSLLGNILGALLGSDPVAKDLTWQINTIFSDLAIKIDSIVKPLIDTLGVNIANGHIKPQSFKNEVSKIQGNISAVVAQVKGALLIQTNLVSTQVAAILAEVATKLDELNLGVVQCGEDDSCQVKLISCITENLVIDVTAWVGELADYATSNVAVLAKGLLVIISDIQTRLALITKDIVVSV